MKILQVIHYFPPFNLGGSELYTYQLSKKLLEKHDVRVFHTAPQDNDSPEVERGCYEGIPCWKLKKNYSTFDPPYYEKNRWVEQEFIRIIENFKPDIVHFQHLTTLSLTLPAIAKKRGVPSCFTLHDFWLLCPRAFLLTQDTQLCSGYNPRLCFACLADRAEYYNTQSRGILPLRLVKQVAKQTLNLKRKARFYYGLARWRPSLVKKIFRDIDQFIAPSRFLLEKYVRAGLPEEKIVFCRHGLDAQEFQGMVKTNSEALRFAFIGTIRFHKGIYVLIDAFNLIPAPHELKIYGKLNVSIREQLQKKIKNPRIHIMGELKNDDRKKAFSDIDILILPSICYENCPLVINEAFMTKTPAIVSDLGGMAELVEEGVSGLKFLAGDSADLARKILMFIHDRSLKDRLASHIPAVKDIAAHAEEINQLYNTILAS